MPRPPKKLPLRGSPCEHCGSPIKRGGSRYCSRACINRVRTGERNPYWKGGVSKDASRYARRFEDRFPQKFNAHREVRKAVARGDLVRLPCECCAAPDRFTHGHHQDYSRPLDVTWLCRPCHLLLHRLIALRKQIDSVDDSCRSWRLRSNARLR